MKVPVGVGGVEGGGGGVKVPVGGGVELELEAVAQVPFWQVTPTGLQFETPFSTQHGCPTFPHSVHTLFTQ